MMVLTGFKRSFLLWVVLCTGCFYPPDEVESMREQLQAQLSRGQVYTIHADTRLSYMIRNSEFNRAGEAERGKLVSSVEKQALAFLDKYRNYEYIRIYFLGEGTAGINSPYLCRRSDNACRITEKREAS